MIKKSIIDYSIPYSWGYLALVIKPTKENIEFIKNILDRKTNILLEKLELGEKYGIFKNDWVDDREEYVINNVYSKNNETYTNGISWDILWEAAKKRKKNILNNDYKNLFMISNEIICQKQLPKDEIQAKEAFKKLKELIKYPNVSLMGGEINNAVKDGRFDFAVMDSNDAICADNGIFIGNGNRGGFANSGEFCSKFKLIIICPRNGAYDAEEEKFIKIEGTNVWCDSFVISKKSRNKKLAYNFIYYYTLRQRSCKKYSFYTSPFQQIIDYDIKVIENNLGSGLMKEYIKEYIPVSKKEGKKYFSIPIISDGPFSVSLLDEYLLLLYVDLVSGKNFYQ